MSPGVMSSIEMGHGKVRSSVGHLRHLGWGGSMHEPRSWAAHWVDTVSWGLWHRCCVYGWALRRRQQEWDQLTWGGSLEEEMLSGDPPRSPRWAWHPKDLPFQPVPGGCRLLVWGSTVTTTLEQEVSGRAPRSRGILWEGP